MRIKVGALKYHLSDAHRHGMLVKIRCHLCNITHHYRPGDLITVCGDVQRAEIAGQFRCERCKGKHFLSADWRNVHGEDLSKLRIRRLVGVRLVRVFDWEEGPV